MCDYGLLIFLCLYLYFNIYIYIYILFIVDAAIPSFVDDYLKEIRDSKGNLQFQLPLESDKIQLRDEEVDEIPDEEEKYDFYLKLMMILN